MTTASDFYADTLVLKKYIGIDVRFLHLHSHVHVCSDTCVKIDQKKTKEELLKILKVNQGPSCRFEFCHVVQLQLQGKTLKIR